MHMQFKPSLRRLNHRMEAPIVDLRFQRCQDEYAQSSIVATSPCLTGL